MTYEERKKQVCKNCPNRVACAYIGRGLEDNCIYLQDVMQGWEYGEEDTLKSLWKDAQGDDLPAIDREVIALIDYAGNGYYKVVFAHRPDPERKVSTSLLTGKKSYIQAKTYDKGGWNQPHVKFWMDVELPEGVE